MTILETLAEALTPLRSLPIIRELWKRIEPEVTRPARRSEAVDYFLNGSSIAQLAARLHPGAHGPVIVIQQRQIENEIRAYAADLEIRLADLQVAAARATGGAAVRAQKLDRRIADLEAERDRLLDQVDQLLEVIERLRAQLAEAAAEKAPAVGISD